MVQQLLAAARAISCFDVSGFDGLYYAVERVHEGDFPAGTWHGVVQADGDEWYWFVDEQGQIGRSQHTLPQGEPLGETVTVPADARPAREFLSLGWQMLEAGLTPDGVPPTDEEWQTLTWAHPSARDDWPEECTRDLLTRHRAELRESPQAIVDLPRKFTEDNWHDLQVLRSRYSADVTLIVGIGWTMRLIVTVMQSNEVSAQHKSAVLTPWLVGEEFRPMELLAHTASRVLDIGQQGMLAAIIDQDRATAEDLVRQALAAPTLDEHLMLLNNAIPHSWSSLTMARFLAAFGDEVQRPKFRKLATLLDERLVRQVHPFGHQLLDIRSGGREWQRHRQAVRLRYEQGGPDAARQTIDQLSSHLLLYPTAVAAQLAPVD